MEAAGLTAGILPLPCGRPEVCPNWLSYQFVAPATRVHFHLISPNKKPPIRAAFHLVGRRESNPRPKTISLQVYMLSSPR